MYASTTFCAIGRTVVDPLITSLPAKAKVVVIMTAANNERISKIFFSFYFLRDFKIRIVGNC